jgi:hypothetical protein
MPLSKDRLVALLSEMQSLTTIERNAIVDTADYKKDGSVGALYFRIIQEKCSHHEIDKFFKGAGAYLAPYGDRDGVHVQADFRQNYTPPPNCIPYKNYICDI